MAMGGGQHPLTEQPGNQDASSTLHNDVSALAELTRDMSIDASQANDTVLADAAIATREAHEANATPEPADSPAALTPVNQPPQERVSPAPPDSNGASGAQVDESSTLHSASKPDAESPLGSLTGKGKPSPAGSVNFRGRELGWRALMINLYVFGMRRPLPIDPSRRVPLSKRPSEPRDRTVKGWGWSLIREMLCPLAHFDRHLATIIQKAEVAPITATDDAENFELVESAGKKLHRCKVCRREIAGRGDFNKHYRTHTNHKPYKCRAKAGCNKRFGDASTRVRHERVHQHERFECKHCGFQYTRKDNRDRHEMKCKGVKRVRKRGSGGNHRAIVEKANSSKANSSKANSSKANSSKANSSKANSSSEPEPRSPGIPPSPTSTTNSGAVFGGWNPGTLGGASRHPYQLNDARGSRDVEQGRNSMAMSNRDSVDTVFNGEFFNETQVALAEAMQRSQLRTSMTSANLATYPTLFPRTFDPSGPTPFNQLDRQRTTRPNLNPYAGGPPNRFGPGQPSWPTYEQDTRQNQPPPAFDFPHIDIITPQSTPAQPLSTAMMPHHVGTMVNPLQSQRTSGGDLFGDLRDFFQASPDVAAVLPNSVAEMQALPADGYATLTPEVTDRFNAVWRQFSEELPKMMQTPRQVSIDRYAELTGDANVANNPTFEQLRTMIETPESVVGSRGTTGSVDMKINALAGGSLRSMSLDGTDLGLRGTLDVGSAQPLATIEAEPLTFGREMSLDLTALLDLPSTHPVLLGDGGVGHSHELRLTDEALQRLRQANGRVVLQSEMNGDHSHTVTLVNIDGQCVLESLDPNHEHVLQQQPLLNP